MTVYCFMISAIGLFSCLHLLLHTLVTHALIHSLILRHSLWLAAAGAWLVVVVMVPRERLVVLGERQVVPGERLVVPRERQVVPGERMVVPGETVMEVAAEKKATPQSRHSEARFMTSS
jgi:hypothetical protein